MVFVFIAMSAIIVSSNILVLFPINDWLTWGAFPYPISLFITELTNRLYGSKQAKKVVYVGFFLAIFMSMWLATPKIAIASGVAFLVSQLLDINIFNRWRKGVWWQAPFFASLAASLVDACLFWNLAFWGENVPLLTWALGDTSVKVFIDLAMLMPFRLVITRFSSPLNLECRG